MPPVQPPQGIPPSAAWFGLPGRENKGLKSPLRAPVLGELPRSAAKQPESTDRTGAER